MNVQKTKNIFFINAFTLLCLVIPFTAFAFTLNYQASLTDNDKIPINGKINMQFSIYNTETEGEPLWNESINDLPVINGILSVIIGEKNGIPDSMIKDYDALFLGIQVGDDAEMTPRSQLFPVPESIEAKHSISSDYSIKAQTVDMYAITADSIADHAVTTTKLADSSVIGEKIAPQTITPDKLAEKYALKDDTPTYGSSGNLTLDGAIQIGSTDDCNSEKGGTLRYNEAKTTMEYCNGIEWHTLYHGPNISDGLLPPGDAEMIIGPESVYQGQTDVTYRVGNIFSASSYLWKIPTDATITDGFGTKEITVSFCSEAGEICVAGENDNGTGTKKCISVEMSSKKSQVFEFQTSYHVFTVPQCVSIIDVELYGAQGESTGDIGGLGAYIKGQLKVIPGQKLFIFVGGQGNTWNGGGDLSYYHQQCDPPCRGGYGGGSTDIRIGGTDLIHRLAVAGGGSGSGGCANYPFPCSGIQFITRKGGNSTFVCENLEATFINMGSVERNYGAPGGGACVPQNISLDRNKTWGGVGGGSYINGLINGQHTPGDNRGNGKAIISW